MKEKNIQKISASIKTSFLFLFLVVIIFVSVGCGKGAAQENTTSKDTGQAPVTVDNDLVIPISEISEEAKFYPVKIGGTEMEVLAVKAPDGTIRTAFNTCQVCYGSGKGYYEQEGDALVCQNCGNRFSMSEVEVSQGGCNPVPIFDEDKTVDKTDITISKEYLADMKSIFADWKI